MEVTEKEEVEVVVQAVDTVNAQFGIKPIDQNASMDTSNRLSSLWNIPPAVMHEAQMRANSIRMSHGMLSGVPLLCQADKCIYKAVCTISVANRLAGFRCPMEAAAVIARFEDYCAHFKIDISTPMPNEEDIVDLSLIKDLIDIEIQILRADNKVAISGDFIVKLVGTVDNRGKAYYEDAIDQASEFKMRLMDKKWKVLQLLDSTRKDKASKQKALNDPSIKAASIFNKINSIMNAKVDDHFEVIEVECEDVEPTIIVETVKDQEV